MSLTARLLLLVLGLLAFVLLGLGLTLGGAVSQWALQAQDEELERRAAAIAGAVKLERSGELELDDDAGEHGSSPLRIETLAGAVLFQTAFDWPALDPERGAVTRQTRSGTELRIFSRSFVPEHAERLPGGGRELVVRVAAPTAALSALAARFRIGLAVALAAGLLLAQAEVSLRRDRTPEEYQQALATIAQAAREAAALSTGLLALSRADASAAALQKEPVRLAELVEELHRLFGARLEAAKVTLELELPPGLVLLADRSRMRELLEELLDNAISWTPPGGRLGVRAAGAGPEIELQVWDTGPGIPREEQPHLFERFFRGAAATRRNTPGSGLGLAIVKAIAEAHGGSVAVADHAGGGAELRVRLPQRRLPL